MSGPSDRAEALVHHLARDAGRWNELCRQIAETRRVSTVLLDPEAIARWDALIAEHGSQRAALEAGLQACHVANPIKSGGK
jgi:hypothetical protein